MAIIKFPDGSYIVKIIFNRPRGFMLMNVMDIVSISAGQGSLFAAVD